MLITGATDGLGRQLALDLASQGHAVLVHGRSGDRGRNLLEEIQQSPNAQASYERADLASLAEVRLLAQRVLADQSRLDVYAFKNSC